jgi:hypothetical protein
MIELEHDTNIEDEAGIVRMANILRGENRRWFHFAWNLNHIYKGFRFVEVNPKDIGGEELLLTGDGKASFRMEPNTVYYATTKVRDQYLARVCHESQRRTTHSGALVMDDDDFTTIMFGFSGSSSDQPECYCDFYLPRAVLSSECTALSVNYRNPDNKGLDRVNVYVEGARITRLHSGAPRSEMNPPHYYSRSGLVFLRPFNIMEASRISPGDIDRKVAEMLDRGLALQDVDRWEWD